MRGAYNFNEAIFDPNTILPDGSHWVEGVDVKRFTDAAHPNFWQPPSPPDDVPYFA